jgi:hypothetical protein
LFCIPVFCAPAHAQVVPPIGELFASGTGNNNSVQLAGSGMGVYSGSELSAGIAPATLKLARGGQVRICPHSGLNVTSSNQGLMLATGAGNIEVDYQLGRQTADVEITPDFNITMVGPGTFHFALGITKKGDTCMKPLPGNAAELTFSELLGTGSYKTAPNQSLIFRGGKLDPPEMLDGECGCPAVIPALRAEAEPSPTPVPPKNENANTVDKVAVAGNEPTSALPPDKPGQVHVQVDAPFVFSAKPGSVRPYSVAKEQLSTLPNTYFVQEKVDPVVLIQKQPEVSLKAEAEAPAAAKPQEEKPKPEKKGFLGRVKGFFGSLFHR